MTYYLMIGASSIGLLAIAFACIGLTIYALVDILKSEFSGNNKIIWVLVVLLANFFGAILYLFMGRQQKISASKS